MRFHLVDRIDEHVPGQSIRARKVTSEAEPYWDTSMGDRRMPPALALEALCQAGAWLVWLSTSGAHRAALVSIASVAFADRPVRPGDVLTLEGRVTTISNETAVLSGSVTVAGELVLRAEDVMCILVDAAMLEDPQETKAREQAVLG